jgi:predicted transcriptional regulator
MRHTHCMTARINARLSADLARKVEALRKRTGQSSTEIVKASLESYYAAVTREENPAALLADLIGCANGPADLSLSYKQELTKSLLRKRRR